MQLGSLKARLKKKTDRCHRVTQLRARAQRVEKKGAGLLNRAGMPWQHAQAGPVAPQPVSSTQLNRE